MLALIRRDLLLYFRNPSGVIFSLMGAMISFVLYLVFLKNSIQADWKSLPGSNLLLDQWLIGGTLAITGITTTLAGLTQVVADRESQVRQDLLQTDIGNVKLTISYLAGASLIGLLMQVIMFAIMIGYFHVQDGLTVTGAQVGLLMALMLLNAALSTAINAIVINFVKHMSSLSSLSTVVGTGAGFLVGGLIPIGTLPDFAQKLIKITPGGYIASLNRQVLMNDKLADTFNGHLAMQHHFEKLLGVRIDWDGLLTRQETLNIVIVALVVATLLAVAPQLIAGRQRRKLTA
ncbi:ABC transporter permease [Lactiplantibacillus sp. WILCCON 0030]|uniref:ABC transporter permease n=1 Tax=Lactiplantibacillus brownii TaxID=3069269 RepID=A0ABU1A7Y3_9LACO|nr:ABC transporter permease [Lactiplantibacillus brownii]MDQ7936765.1 ABC transporter permease [Lactiplantibacillus brownii]